MEREVDREETFSQTLWSVRQPQSISQRSPPHPDMGQMECVCVCVCMCVSVCIHVFISMSKHDHVRTNGMSARVCTQCVRRY